MIKQLNYFLLISLTLFTSSCTGQIKEKSDSKNKEILVNKTTEPFKYGAGDVVTDGYMDNLGNMWFTTLKEGVFKYDGKTFTNISEKDGLCSNAVNAVLEDEKGIMWFGTAKGLCSFDGTNFTNIPLPTDTSENVSPKTGIPSRKTETVLSLIQAQNGDFWIGTDASGAYRFDGKKFTSFLKFEGRIQPNDNVYNNCITSILEDKNGNIWFTSMTHGGISRYDRETMTHFTTKDGLLGDMIKPSFEDSKGDIWFGSIQNLEGGINIYNGTSFRNFTKKDGLCDSNVACFYEDESGIIWIGTGNGICYYDGKAITSFTSDGESFGDIRFIIKDKDSNMWFGGRYGSLYRYDGKELKDFTQTKRTN